jgi:hypothetical protein
MRINSSLTSEETSVEVSILEEYARDNWRKQLVLYRTSR